MQLTNIFNKNEKMGPLRFRIHATRLAIASVFLAISYYGFNTCASKPFISEMVQPIYNAAAMLSLGSMALMILIYTPIISILRLRDAGLPAHLAWILLIPGVGTLLFMALLYIPKDWRQNYDIDRIDDY